MHHIHIHAPCTHACTACTTKYIHVCIDAPHTHICMTNQRCIYVHHIYTHTCTTKHTCVHRWTTYTYMHHMHIHAPHAQPKICGHRYTYMHHMHTCAPHASSITGAYTHTCITKHICVHRCTIYIYMYHVCTACAPHVSVNTWVHHQTLPKIKIHTYLAFPVHSMKDQVKIRDLCWISCLVFQKKDLYLVITQKLTKLHMKTIAVFVKSTWKVKSTLKSNKNSLFNTDLSFWPGVSYSTEGRPTMYILCFGGVWWWHVCLVVHACVYGAHICNFNCVCMWCMYVHVVIYAHIWWCMYVHMVHVCVYGASMKSTWKVKST